MTINGKNVSLKELSAASRDTSLLCVRDYAQFLPIFDVQRSWISRNPQTGTVAILNVSGTRSGNDIPSCGERCLNAKETNVLIFAHLTLLGANWIQ